jgi:serpin B
MGMMKTFSGWRFWRCLPAFFLISTLPACAGVAPTNVMNALVTGNNTFACDLYGRLRTNQGNLFFSPYSLSTCLAMTCAGARGNTEKQMSQVLHGDLQRQLNQAQEKRQIELNTANAIWAQQGHPFLPAFLDIASQHFGATLKQTDFRAFAEPARNDINTWVGERTKGRITARMVLVNAIYFKGQWARQFIKADTTNAMFSVNAEQRVQTQLMHVTGSFKYASVNSLQILEMPYLGGDLSLLVLLPTDAHALRVMETFVSESSLRFWQGLTREQKVEVFLPKFKMTAQLALAETLAGMGMTDAFSDTADFSGMDGARDLYLSAVVHKAFVEVNEEGTEAAAASGAVVSLTSAMPAPVPVFRADHPFIFYIRDTRSGSVLFLGRLSDPTK